MLHAQANWYPGWKLTSHIPLVKGQMESFVAEVSEDIPASNFCPRLHQRIEELREKCYNRSELEIGWFVVGGGEEGTIGIKCLRYQNSVEESSLPNSRFLFWT